MNDFKRVFSIANCWLCGCGACTSIDNGLYKIYCENCKKRGININVIHSDQNECVKIWNQSNQQLTKDDVYELVRLVSKTNNYKLIEKLNQIYLYNFMFQKNDKNRFGFGAMIDNYGNIIECDESHIQKMLKYLDLDESYGLDPENSDYYYDLIINSEVFKQNFVKISSFLTYLNIDIPTKFTNEQMKSLILTLKRMIDENINFNIFKLDGDFGGKIFSNFDDLIKYIVTTYVK